MPRIQLPISQLLGEAMVNHSMPLLPSSSSKAFRKAGLHGREGALGHAKQLDNCDSGGYVWPLLLYMVLFSVCHIFVKVQAKKKKRKTLRYARARAIWLYGKGDFRILAPFLFVNVFRVFGWILCPIIVYFTIQKISLMATTDPPFGLTWKDELRLKICRSAGQAK